MIDQTTIRELLSYDSQTGVFVWKHRDRAHFTRASQFANWNGRFPGAVAGRVGPKGYRAIGIFGKLYPAHRLAWLYEHGSLPSGQVDHINGVRDDNRIANLRDVDAVQNGRNRRLSKSSTTGRIGVSPYPYHGSVKFVARIRADGRLHHLGYFDTIDEAAAARTEAEARFGFHPNHGKKMNGTVEVRS